ncbi:hypothetical protein KPL74_06040 [Bacillus sp. NP157]|nr:hypothetical protein KPL74_06040 [Bacillus sp. NP157]
MRQQPPDEPGEESQQHLADMRREMEEMRVLVRQLIGTNAVENVLINGFCKLSAQLEPLAELTPPRRTPMDPKDMARLAHVRAELKRPTWIGTGSLETPHPSWSTP